MPCSKKEREEDLETIVWLVNGSLSLDTTPCTKRYLPMMILEHKAHFEEGRGLKDASLCAIRWEEEEAQGPS